MLLDFRELQIDGSSAVFEHPVKGAIAFEILYKDEARLVVNMVSIQGTGRFQLHDGLIYGKPVVLLRLPLVEYGVLAGEFNALGLCWLCSSRGTATPDTKNTVD
jgi:hypothetical protein